MDQRVRLVGHLQQLAAACFFPVGVVGLAGLRPSQLRPQVMRGRTPEAFELHVAVLQLDDQCLRLSLQLLALAGWPRSM
jgi:hypothetical protein